MDYGISFNNDDTVLAALEELNNTFFTEYSNSDNEKEPSIIPDNNDGEEVASNFNDNTSNLDDNIYLNNFKFEEISNNYIEDEVYNRLKLKIKEFFEKGKCSCRSPNQPCFTKIGYKRFLHVKLN